MTQLVKASWIICFFRFDFNDKWRSWIRIYVFLRNPVVLLNHYLTEEIKIKWGLKHGDPLTPFLFLLLAKGLSGLFKRAIELNLFSGFKVGSYNLEISHLQYVDDTLLGRSIGL